MRKGEIHLTDEELSRMAVEAVLQALARDCADAVAGDAEAAKRVQNWGKDMVKLLKGK